MYPLEVLGKMSFLMGDGRGGHFIITLCYFMLSYITLIFILTPLY